MVGGGTRAGSSALLLVLGLAVLAASVLTGTSALTVAPLVAVLAMLVAANEVLLRWQNLFALVVAVVWFVPIKFYRLPGRLPFDLELYRAVLAVVLAAWGASLLIDPRVRLRRTAFDAPVVVLVVAVLLSELTNPGRVTSVGSNVLKSITFLLSYLLLFYFVASVLRQRPALEAVIRVLTLCGTFVAGSAVVERRTGYNLFYHLHSVLPFLQFLGAPIADRQGRLRVLGSAQHPIALGAAFAVMVPLSIYLARTSGRRWWLTTLVLTLGIMGTASRTAIVMLATMAAVYLWLKRAETARMWPALLPALIVIHFALPGALGTIKDAFFPPGGIVAEQTRLPPNGNPLLAGGRLRLLGPSLDQASQRPLFGFGWGTRITGFDNPNRNAPILDNQWLGTLLEIGAIGVIAFGWLVVRAVRRLREAAARAGPADSWLYASLAASLASFALGMLTYDAFSFIQATFLFWMLLAIAAALLGSKPLPEPAT